jgi:hypothetical protein
MKFQGYKEHFKLIIGKLNSLVTLKNKIQECFSLKIVNIYKSSI